MVDAPDKPHDALFRETFSDEVQAGAVLRSVLPGDVVALLDWDTLRLESGSFVGVGDDARHCDLLFSVEPVESRARVLVYVLFEHQSQNDPLMALRVLEYMTRIWSSWAKRSDSPPLPLPVILPVVLSHDERGWRSGTRFSELFELDGEAGVLRPFVPDFELVVDDLAQASDEDLLARRLPTFAALVLWALRDGRSGKRVLEHVIAWAPEFNALAQQPGGPADIDRLIFYLGVAGGKRSVSPQALAQRLIEESSNDSEVIMSSLLRQLENAEREGRDKGREEGVRGVLTKLLRQRFGELPDDAVARIEAADDAALERYAERVLTADSLAAVFGG